ncbi:phosphatase 2C family protein [Striga asiatica]|uniref:protein-serine/threonine phosphatase n=1 Tax=Striga asiatica TaxID=4170 RepID=A0A5A7PS85_STRAF|nr:phosphatase 2C family protein [Striga asiatica]
MGNGAGKLAVCFTGVGPTAEDARRRRRKSMVMSDPPEDLGHSFCYIRPELTAPKVHSEETTTTTSFKSISGAAVSANTSTPLSTDLFYSLTTADRAASAFEGSTSFASIPLQPIPRAHSGPIPNSGPLDRGFMSGPIERAFLSGPLDHFQRSYSHGGLAFRPRSRKLSLIRAITRALSKGMARGHNSIVAPEKQSEFKTESSFDDDDDVDKDCTMGTQNLQWAQGKAGEDRVHVVVSEEHGWVFVGIYDGFNGPDAPDYLLSNLYPAVHKELKGLLWDDNNSNSKSENLADFDPCTSSAGINEDLRHCKKRSRNSKSKYRGVAKKWEENHRTWRCEWNRERLELDKRLKEQSEQVEQTNHGDVLKALSRALRETEEAYFDVADQMGGENPELALMGSCVLVTLMKGEDVYVMNVGDSRAVLARNKGPDLWSQDLERINEETLYDLESFDEGVPDLVPSLTALQLTNEHSTSVEEEVERIRNEHRDDACAVINDRVKGSLKVTRAFGAGFLKQPKWNNALLEAFRIDFIGSSPYLNCLPSLYHHKLGPRDRFLILSSDGLYQYFTNEEVVSEVELFISWSPEGDPAQHLLEELLFRAAKRAGMDFHELLEIPQGDRRRYHDDVSIIVISLEGRIWKSCA